MIKIGIILDNVGVSQLAYYAIQQSNKIIESRDDSTVIVFYCNMAKPCTQPCFPIMQIAEAWGFEGILISTDLQSTQKMLVMPSAEKKIFYIWDLEWTRGQVNNYHAMAEIYQNEDLTLIARSEEHKKAIEDAWNRPVRQINSDFDLEQVLELC